MFPSGGRRVCRHWPVLGLSIPQSLFSMTSQVSVGRQAIRQPVLCLKCLGDSGSPGKGLNPPLGCQAELSRGGGSPPGMIPPTTVHLAPPSVFRETSGNTLVVPSGVIGSERERCYWNLVWYRRGSCSLPGQLPPQQ